MSDEKNLFNGLGQASDFEKKLVKRGVTPVMVRVASDNAWCLDLLAETFKGVFGMAHAIHLKRLRVKIPSVRQMMAMNDHEFISIYVNHMAAYKLPVKCWHPKCETIIYNACDLRKLAGICLCPEHFYEEVPEYGKESEYLLRARSLLPTRMLGLTPSEAQST